MLSLWKFVILWKVQIILNKLDWKFQCGLKGNNSIKLIVMKGNHIMWDNTPLISGNIIINPFPNNQF